MRYVGKVGERIYREDEPRATRQFFSYEYDALEDPSGNYSKNVYCCASDSFKEENKHIYQNVLAMHDNRRRLYK